MVLMAAGLSFCAAPRPACVTVRMARWIFGAPPRVPHLVNAARHGLGALPEFCCHVL